MADFDVDQFLDNVGIIMSQNGLTAGDLVFDSSAGKLTFADELSANKQNQVSQMKIIDDDHKKWHNKRLFKPGSLLKTKTGFPLCFECKADGSLWDDSSEFDKSSFFLSPNMTFHLVDEGIVKVGKVVPVKTGMPQSMATISKEYTCGRVDFHTAAFFECRYLRAIAHFNGRTQGPRGYKPGPATFFILFDREIGRKYSDKFLFDVLVEGTARRTKLRTVDYSNVLSMEQPISSI